MRAALIEVVGGAPRVETLGDPSRTGDDQVRHELNAGHLGHDQGDLNAAIRDCGQALARARSDARALSKTTGDAQNAISAVHSPLSPDLGGASPSQQAISEPKDATLLPYSTSINNQQPAGDLSAT